MPTPKLSGYVKNEPPVTPKTYLDRVKDVSREVDEIQQPPPIKRKKPASINSQAGND